MPSRGLISRTSAVLATLPTSVLLSCGGGGGDQNLAPIAVPAAIEAVSGSHQTGEAGAALTQPVVAKVTTSSGAGLEGARVRFEVRNNRGVVSASSATTNGDGLASTGWTVGTVVGTQIDTVRATVDGLDAAAIFVATVAPGPPASITAISGDGQSAALGRALPQPLIVEARDLYGNPTSHVTVTWATQGGGSVVSAITVTGAEGRASNIWTLGSGQNVATASVSGLAGSPVVFSASLTATGLQLSAASGNNQSGPPGQALAQPLVVLVRNQTGAPVAGVGVHWIMMSGGGSVSAGTSPTSTEGRAVVQWTLGSAEGPQTVEARVDGASGSPVLFSAIAQSRPSGISILSGDGQSGQVGRTLTSPLVVLVTYASGSPASNVAVTWTPVGGGAVSSSSVQTDGTGHASITRTLGITAGPQSTRASAQGLSGSVTFTHMAVAGSAASLVKVSGDNQSADLGEELDQPLVVRVRDGFDNPVPNQTVTWVVNIGNGMVDPAGSTTDESGEASTRWTLGSAGENSVIAHVSGVAGTVTFNARGVPSQSFDIVVRFLGTPTASQREVFERAAARWESIIVGDLPDGRLVLPAGACGSSSPEIDEQIDDLMILASVGEIDGPGQTLAIAGPCIVRPSLLPGLGQMVFDVTDFSDLQATGTLVDVVVHEMGHVLGIGTLWSDQGLLSGASLLGGTDPFFTGPLAVAAFDAAGGISYTAGHKVPVENEGGPGTADGHWRESVMGTELMTGYVSLPGVRNPLSTVTIRSLQDQGYSVDPDRADPYTLAASLRATQQAQSIWLGDDVSKTPIRVVDSDGRLIRTITR